jgi:ATP/ADP translocase
MDAYSAGYMIGRLLIQLIVLAIFLIPMSNIVKRAGYSPWLTLLGLVPIVNLVMFLVFAFSTWPRQRAETPVAETFE